MLTSNLLVSKPCASSSPRSTFANTGNPSSVNNMLSAPLVTRSTSARICKALVCVASRRAPAARTRMPAGATTRTVDTAARTLARALGMELSVQVSSSCKASKKLADNTSLQLANLQLRTPTGSLPGQSLASPLGHATLRVSGVHCSSHTDQVESFHSHADAFLQLRKVGGHVPLHQLLSTPEHSTFRCWVPKPQKALHVLHSLVLQAQVETSWQCCQLVGPAPHFSGVKIQVDALSCLPKPQVLLHLDQGPTIQPQPSELMQASVVAGRANKQSSSRAPGHHTLRVLLPVPQGAEHADHSEVRHVQAYFAVHICTAEGRLFISQSFPPFPLQTTLRFCKPEPQVALHKDHAEGVQPQDAESLQSCRSKGLV